MSILLLLLEVYFASILGVSALAKLADPRQFRATLQRYQLFPSWSIAPTATLVPYLQLLVSGLLVTGVVPRLAGLLTVGFFLSFLVIESILVITKRATDCGCFGLAYRQKVDGASIAASGLLVTTALFHSWAVASITPVNGGWRAAAGLIIAAIAVCLSWRIVGRRHLHPPAVPETVRIQQF